MNIIIFVLVMFSISVCEDEDNVFFRSMEKLDASPTDRCLVQDINGISYVKKCKKGKYCQKFKNGNYTQGICVNFKLPLFVDDACLSNEECLTQNCDNGKCKEQDFCFNDNQCEKGKYCDMHKPDGTNTYKCIDMKKKSEDAACYSSEECGIFRLCKKNSTEIKEEGQCIRIGSLNDNDVVFVFVNDTYSEKYNKYLCTNGQIDDANTCSNPNSEDITCNENDYCKSFPNIKCQYNPIENYYYCPYSNLQSTAFKKYKSEIDKQFGKYENDDKMWNWNNNRLHADKKELKEYLFYYENPIFTKYNVEYSKDDDEDALDVVEFLQQMYLNSNWLKTSIKKFFLIIITMII
jgi:hypothetical protein